MGYLNRGQDQLLDETPIKCVMPSAFSLGPMGFERKGSYHGDGRSD